MQTQKLLPKSNQNPLSVDLLDGSYNRSDVHPADSTFENYKFKRVVFG